MPPQITFVKVSSRVLPVKVFVSKAGVGSSSNSRSSLAINETSLITLNNRSNYFHIRLSNNFLSQLVNVQLNEVLLSVLLKAPLRELVENRDDTWVKLRQTTSDELDKLTIDDIEFVNSGKFKLENILKEKNSRADNSLLLMTKRNVFNNRSFSEEPTILVEEDESLGLSEGSEVEKENTDKHSDDKKSVSYKVNGLRMFNNTQNCMKLYMIGT
ncbi:hypothetical protein G9P44_005365 [Scheffersomyces stipitis]|nr:hypothetical protein G9P44_005365 [Scheffersomyces stipitis]